MSQSYNSDTTVTVECAFGDDPLATPTWTEITSDVRGFTTKRGRSRILDEVQAGTASLMLNNSSGNYSPWNTSGTHSPNVRVFTPIRIRANYNSTDYDLFRGFVTKWPNQWPGGGKDPVVPIECVDAFRLMAMYEAELTESEEFAGTRIGNLLDTMGWPAGWRDIDTGQHNVQALSAEFNSVLGEIFRSVLVENGLFWIAGDGDATFRDGDTRIEDDTIQATFSDDGADSKYVEVQVDYDDTQLWNSATVTRADGTNQTSSDATSIGDYGERDLHLSETVHVADGEALALADWLVSEFKDVRARISQVSLKPEADPAQLWPEALGLEILDKVNVERTDVTGDSFDEDCYIEGVSHSVTMMPSRSWVTTFQLSPDLQFSNWWILGTSELGTDTRLGY